MKAQIGSGGELAITLNSLHCAREESMKADRRLNAWRNAQIAKIMGKVA